MHSSFYLTFVFPKLLYYQQEYHNLPASESLQFWTHLQLFLILRGGKKHGAIYIVYSLQAQKG